MTVRAIVASIFFAASVGLASVAAADCGDADGDDAVTATDALVVLRGAVGISGDCDANCDCDVDANRELTSVDALATLRVSVGSDSPGCGFYDECFDDEECEDGDRCGTDPDWTCDAACVPE